MYLIITNSGDKTCDYFLSKVRNGKTWVRLDTDQMMSNTAIDYSTDGIELCFEQSSYEPDDFSGVWFRRPKPVEMNSEMALGFRERRFVQLEWSAALEGFFSEIPEHRWINHPTANRGAINKLGQLQRAREIGFKIPKSIVTQDTEVATRFCIGCEGGVIVKPLSHGILESDPDDTAKTAIYTSRVRKEMLGIAGTIEAVPTLLQSEIEKECDVRVMVVDTRMQAVRIDHKIDNGSQILDVRRNGMVGAKYSELEVPRHIETCIRALLENYCLRFAALDFAIDSHGDWVFFEVNPSGEWAWLEEEGVCNVSRLLEDALIRRL